MDKNAMKTQFYEHIRKTPQKSNSFHMSLEKYSNLLREVKRAKKATSKENRHYWLLKKELQQRYKNITTQDIQIFLNLCELCLKKRKNAKKELIKPMVFSQLTSSRCQVDLIDFQSQADREFKFILIYQDLLTKFVILKALKSKQAAEVAEHLLHIFTLFGAPAILQSGNGQEFVSKVIKELKNLWPELKIISGKSVHSEENIIQDTVNKLNKWMTQEQCCNWSKGLGFVQFMKNRSFHKEIKKSPFEATFGQQANVGLSSSLLPQNLIKKINSEEDLDKMLDHDRDKANVFQNEIFEEQTSGDLLLKQVIVLIEEPETGKDHAFIKSELCSTLEEEKEEGDLRFEEKM